MISGYKKWIAALFSVALICVIAAVGLQAVTGQSSAACAPGCQCQQGGPCTCAPGTCGNRMCPGSPGYAASPEGGYGMLPTAFPEFPTIQPGMPLPTPGGRMPVPRPTMMPGMPMPSPFPGMPGMPFPGRGTPTPAPTVTPVPTEMPSPTVTPVPAAEPTPSLMP